jgi:glycine/D-amino acid oxidase-like deaminating enzyme
MRVAVVGAGICGLAAAYELRRRGADVVVYASGGVGGGQSLGLARIFRIAHASPELCALALEAREGWQAWEREFGVHLLGDEGLVVVGDTDRAEAMRTAGAPVERLERVPFEFLDYDWGGGIVDPLAGSLRVRRALEALADHVRVVVRTVTDIDAVEADAVLVCAGIGTQALVPELDFELTYDPHVRVTFALGRSAPCVISPELYGCPIGSTGYYAIGMHDLDARARTALEPVGRIECVSPHAPWLDAHGDGFRLLRRGRVTAFTGSNLMKFGPVIGAMLAEAVLAGADQDRAGGDQQ